MYIQNTKLKVNSCKPSPVLEYEDIITPVLSEFENNSRILLDPFILGFRMDSEVQNEANCLFSFSFTLHNCYHLNI